MLALKMRPRRLQNASKTARAGSQDEVRDFFRSGRDFNRFLIRFTFSVDCLTRSAPRRADFNVVLIFSNIFLRVENLFHFLFDLIWLSLLIISSILFFILPLFLDL